jgi:hypothetical protein
VVVVCWQVAVIDEARQRTPSSEWAAAGFPDTFDGTMCLGEIDGNEKKVQR